MTEANSNHETERGIEAGSSSDEGETLASDHDGSSAEGTLPRRGALALLTALGLGGVATGNASAGSGDHLGELWDGSPGTGRGLETVLREKGQALKGTAGTNTNDTNDIGVKGTTYSTRGIGLEGLAAASSGNTIGLKGRTDSPDGTALFGIARNTSAGSSLAVEGLSRAEDGTAMQGHATGSGDTVGVEGRVDSADGYGLYTPDDARIDGVLVTDDTDFVVTTGDTSSKDAKNVIHGHASNAVATDVDGATIGGGGYDDGSVVQQNLVNGSYGTVAGGLDNAADATGATIAGGEQNTASGGYATVGGGGGTGEGNAASGANSTVSGGDNNTASGNYATVGGGSYNDARADYATIAGGGTFGASISGPPKNVVYDDYGTIGGGGTNRAGSDDGDTDTAEAATVGGGFFNHASAEVSTVGGGSNNDASSEGSTVGGGRNNDASGGGSTVAGGAFNTASGQQSTVAGGDTNTADERWATVPGGSHGKAANRGSFVWNDDAAYHDTDGDGTDEGLSSSQDIAGSGVTGEGTFHASARGGFRFITGPSSVTYISGGSTGWATTSTRTAKTNIDPVEPEDVLAGVEEMEVSTWEYKDGDGGGEGVRHMGPMAEAFHTAFDLGASDTGINSINADGVAFAAIQGLSQQLDEKDDRIEELEEKHRSKEEQIGDLEGELRRKDERIDDLEKRLTALESLVGPGTVPADD